ncbi:hypothetical protein BG015_008802 [Linnemannia schmuckeri]|uniref:Uncharacterized protein n=1 Tax=Linnemannia schmuckeri TaxID=64567 RepID=A0A9P5S010_9FUNG|nr:hypothetical protein BG015_008802 [Linnemannia schmuckeri]
MTATTSNASTPANGEAPPVASHEVGMMFVHEYYTFLNKEPYRLHCFYNKQSTMSHGIQGEDTEVCHGQQSIHAKILALDFEDCKVLVSNVDSQTSLNGGIMIQVLGEMSNRGGPSQKFVQTFFLAQQPKGFYVLNDIFRYLKDDSEVEAEVAEEEQQQKVEPEVANPSPAYEPEIAICPPAPVPEPEIAICPPAPAPVAEPEIAICPPAPEPEVVISPPAPEPVVEEKKPAVEEKKVEKKQEHKKHDKKGDKKDTKKDAAKKEADVAEKAKTPEPTKKQNGAPAAAAAAETAAPASETPTPVVEAPAPAPAPVPAGPPKPKTWANLAANNLDQWGSQASAAKGSSVNIPQPAAPKPQVVSQPKPQQQQQQQGAPHKVNGRDEFFPIYVKAISERISEEQLREAFGKFGTVKGLDFTRQRNCAYVDFTTADAMHAALKQNKVAVGSEFVYAEERRPRPTFQNRPPSHFQNGNGGINGHQGPQGGHRGGRPARGSFQDRKPIQRPEKPAPTVAVN